MEMTLELMVKLYEVDVELSRLVAVAGEQNRDKVLNAIVEVFKRVKNDETITPEIVNGAWTRAGLH